jgi:hypothetical protein
MTVIANNMGSQILEPLVEAYQVQAFFCNSPDTAIAEHVGLEDYTRGLLSPLYLISVAPNGSRHSQISNDSPNMHRGLPFEYLAFRVAV